MVRPARSFDELPLVSLSAFMTFAEKRAGGEFHANVRPTACFLQISGVYFFATICIAIGTTTVVSAGWLAAIFPSNCVAIVGQQPDN